MFPKVILANGVWDRFHYGHLIHLKEAARLGYLVVSITSDSQVKKGPGRPIYPQGYRAAIVESLRCVDEVIIVETLLEALAIIKPDILVKGIDYQSGLDKEHTEYCKEHDIEIRFTTTPKMSADGPRSR